MTISHYPVGASFLRRKRLQISCRTPDCSKDPPVSERSSGRAMDPRSDILFTAFPVELRAEVFLQFCRDGWLCPIGKATEGPLLLLQVCRAWKELALQAPQLWTSFELVVVAKALPGPKQSEFLLSAMKRWIDRSRNLPLSFKLEYPESDATCHNLIRCILSSSARWHDVALKVPSTSLLPLWDAASNSFPSLRTLSMETFGACPFVLKDLGLDWARITELNLSLITFPNLDDFLHILTDAVSLKRCTMDALCVFNLDHAERVSLPQLEHLALTMYGNNNGGILPGRPELRFLAFLRTLSLPGLKSLTVGWALKTPPHQTYWSDCHTGFVHFLEESAHLDDLHLQWLPFDATQVIQCLRVLPLLTTLSLSSLADDKYDFINNELLDALTPQSRCSELLPLLRNIQLESDAGHSFDNPVLLRFIASRWRYQESTSGHLAHVTLVSSTRNAEYHRLGFRDLKDGVIDVKGRLEDPKSMLNVISSFLDRDSYGKVTCFMNRDFPSNVRSLLIG